MRLFKAYVYDLLEIHYSTLGFMPEDEDEEHLDILARIRAVEWMCKLDYDDCVHNALEYFQAWMNLNLTIPVGFEATVLNTAIQSENLAWWEFLLEKFKTATLDSDKQRYVKALTRIEDAATILRLALDFIFINKEIYEYKLHVLLENLLLQM